MDGGIAWGLTVAVALAAAGGGYVFGRRRPAPVAGPQPLRDPAPLEVLRHAFAALPDACLLIDLYGRVVMRNTAAGDLTGAVEGKPFAAAFRIPAVLQAVDRVLDEGPAEEISFTLPVPIERTIEAHVAPLGAAGYGAHAVVLLRDTTAMTRVERMRADFVANASHELRTPLTSLSGFIETIRGPARDDPEAQARFLEIMQTQADRMRRLIDDLLSLSRIELNEHVRPSGKVDLAGIAGDVVDAVQPQLGRAGIKAIITAEPGVPSVLGERDELIQVVQNLLDNAVKYGSEGGDVAIRIGAVQELTGMMVTCAVSDKGPGIAREHLPRLTERFYRVDAKASRERGGTGLGLAIVKHIVNRHRGRLEIESEPGQGSRFTVFLPALTAS
ncbi:Adaptive-response sensory-kinase SasA [Alphaproteobacteria bacterium SO-S41]|nr:Adaptive-response sensory-kinase SasA [Alphaproteobacteria bacterium SO-S41]